MDLASRRERNEKVLTSLAHAIRRKPLRASTTIGNSIACPAVVDVNDIPDIPRRKPHRASTTIGIFNEHPNIQDGPSSSHPPSQQPAQTVARKPLDPNTRARASISTPNLLAASKPIIDEANPLDLHHTSSLPPSRNRSTKRLSKPPRVHVRKQIARNKLQKRPKKNSTTHAVTPHVFLLQYEQYPYNTQPGTFLGAFSTFQAVTTAAFKHGAYAFSKDGVHDGTEYLSKTGRIKILPSRIQHTESRVKLPKARQPSTRQPNGDVIREESPARVSPPRVRPDEHATGPIPIDGKHGVLVAVHQSPTGIFCIGAFTNRRAAWAACLKHEASLFDKNPLQEVDKWRDEFQMPRMKAREVGKGWHEWFVVVQSIDEAIVSTA